ncbi:MAG: MFS transporter [Patescibacteria group bacterium]|nr:MFS transporter [Patescibacteria group bacterium]
MENILLEKEKSLWHNFDYLRLWTGQAISAFGSQASHIVLPLLILDLTHSPAQAGFVGALTTVPYVVLSLFAGTLVDRLNRKKVMVICDIGRALALGSVFVALFFHHLSLIQIYIVALLEGLFFVFFDIAEISSIRQVVGKKHLTTAIAQSSTTDGLASLIGPSVGTFLYQIKQSFPFLLDTISYIVSVFSLLTIKTEFQEERNNDQANIKKEIKEGISWLLKNKVVRFMSLLNTGVSFVFADLYLILIVLAKEQHSTPVQIGSIISISAIGSTVGSLLAGQVKDKISPGKIIITACWIQALLWPLYIFAPNFIFIGIITAVITFINSIWAIVQINYRLTLIPDELQGRVNSVFRFIIYSIIPLGMAITGIMLQNLGAKMTIIIFFFALIFLAVLATLSKELKSTQVVAENKFRPQVQQSL